MIVDLSGSLPNRTRGRTGDDRVRFDIAGDHGTGAYHSTLSDTDSGQDDGAVANPCTVADDHIAALVRKVRRLRVVPQGQDRGLGADGNVISHANGMPASVEKAVEVDHIPIAQKDLPPVEKTAPHLHPGAATKTRQVELEVSGTQATRGKTANQAVVEKSEQTAGQNLGIHELLIPR